MDDGDGDDEFLISFYFHTVEINCWKSGREQMNGL